MTKSDPRAGLLSPGRPQRDGLFSALPAGETARMARRVHRLGRWMDTAFEVPLLGWRFGWDALIGLIPGAGDAATTFVSLYIMALAGRCGIPRVTVARMALNVAIDMLVGSLPLVGDLFDVWWRANQRNAMLLQERLTLAPAGSRRATAADGIFVGAILTGLVVLFLALLSLAAMAVGAIRSGLAGLLGG